MLTVCLNEKLTISNNIYYINIITTNDIKICIGYLFSILN